MKKIIIFSVLVAFLCSSIAYSQGPRKKPKFPHKKYSGSINSKTPSYLRHNSPAHTSPGSARHREFGSRLSGKENDHKSKPHISGWSENTGKDKVRDHGPINTGKGAAVNVPFGK